MLDAKLRPLIDGGLNRMGRALAERGIAADEVTLFGLFMGLVAALMLGFGLPGVLALVPLAIGRIADGLDGAVARLRGKTDFGGVLDIACDFVFYAAIPLGFVLADPAGLSARAELTSGEPVPQISTLMPSWSLAKAMSGPSASRWRIAQPSSASRWA